MKPGKLHDFLAIVLVNWIQKTSFPEAKGRVREAAEVSTCGACACTRRSSKPSRVAHGYGYSTRICYRTPVPVTGIPDPCYALRQAGRAPIQ